jgi:hypothetical protein
MKAAIGMMALYNDNWLQIMAMRSDSKGRREYVLRNTSHWIPEKWIKEVKGSI